MDRQNSLTGSSSRLPPASRGASAQPHHNQAHGPANSRPTEASGPRHARGHSTSTASGKRSSPLKEKLTDAKKKVASQAKAAEASDAKALVKNDQLLELYKQDYEAIKSLITCKICYGLMYEPFTTSCGHTYCYSCLFKSWAPHDEPKCCPECRTQLQSAPAPSFLLRDLTSIFIKRPQLLPDEETVEQHKETQTEQRALVQRDRDSPRGLFLHHFGSARPNRAAAPRMGMTQCPMCMTDLDTQTQRCSGCGLGPDDYYDPYPSGEDEDYPIDAEDFFSEQESMTEDAEFDEVDDGFDEVDTYEFSLDYLPEEDEEMDEIEELSDISAFQNGAISSVAMSAAMQRYMEDSQPRRPASHSSSASRPASRRYSVPSSGISEYGDSEMAVVEEEDEDGEGDSSMSGLTDEELRTGAEETEQSMHSARSSPSSVATGESSASSTSRRRRRADSNTPTPSMTQPSRRRRRLSPSSIRSTALRARESENSRAAEDSEGYETEAEEASTVYATIASSTNGNRPGRSITPTADQPFPTIHRPVASSASRASNTSRPLRSRGSVIAINASHYDDDADDETTTSRLSGRTGESRGTRRRNVVDEPGNDSDEGGVELDSAAPRRGGPTSRPFDERVRHLLSGMPQNSMGGRQHVGHLEDVRSMTRTPVSRPRTSNRNRANQLSPGSNGPSSSMSRTSSMQMSRSRTEYEQNLSPTEYALAATFPWEPLSRPNSRLGGIHRPPSAGGRRGMSNSSAAAYGSPALMIRNTRAGASGNNPFRVIAAPQSRTLREQTSTATIRGAPSNQTLRSSNSRGNFRAGGGPPASSAPPRAARMQSSPVEQNPRLNHTPSMMRLPQSILPPTSIYSHSSQIGYGQATTTLSFGPSIMPESAGARDVRNPGRGLDPRERIQSRMQQEAETVHARRAGSDWARPMHPSLPYAGPSSSSTVSSYGMNITRPSANPFSRAAGLAGPPPPSSSSGSGLLLQQQGASQVMGSGGGGASSVPMSPGQAALFGVNRMRNIRGLASTLSPVQHQHQLGSVPSGGAAASPRMRGIVGQMNTRSGGGGGVGRMAPSQGRGYDGHDGN